MKNNKFNLAIIGLGYVGLPLAIEFAKNQNIIAFDKNKNRIKALQNNIDHTLEVPYKTLSYLSNKITYTFNYNHLKNCNFYIVCVPTPITKKKNPDLSYLYEASKMIGKVLKKGDIVVYESTVFPGCTEEFCIPILERISGLCSNTDFFYGYSPERINPGDKKHTLRNVKKIVAGSNNKSSKIIESLYKSIVPAGIHKTKNIKTAEASKVIENIQRDVNIALINELSILLSKMNIDSENVLTAASTKWNFINFKPGLVGGHCIGVDPYYLTYKSKLIGYDPKIILAGRGINNGMPKHIVNTLKSNLKIKKIKINGSRSLIMGLTFKENCPDCRNSKVFEIIELLKKNKISVDIYDPWVRSEDQNFKLNLVNKLSIGKYDSIILAVAHKEFYKFSANYIHSLGKKNHVVYDLKHILKEGQSDIRL